MNPHVIGIIFLQALLLWYNPNLIFVGVSGAYQSGAPHEASLQGYAPGVNIIKLFRPT